VVCLFNVSQLDYNQLAHYYLQLTAMLTFTTLILTIIISGYLSIRRSSDDFIGSAQVHLGNLILSTSLIVQGTLMFITS
jgi:hypothetical protein